MASGRPLFPGSTVEDELHLIFRLLGKWILLAVMLVLHVCSSKHFFHKNCRSLSINNDILYCIIIKVNECTPDDE